MSFWLMQHLYDIFNFEIYFILTILLEYFKWMVQVDLYIKKMKTVILSILLFVYCKASAKKGLAMDTAMNERHLSSVGAQWWYNYETKPHISSPAQFVPMVFSLAKMSEVPPYSTHLLGMNEPNLHNETPEQIGAVWQSLVDKAGTIASPAQSGNPYRDNSWLEQFTKLKSNPKFSYVALHGYGTYHPQSFKDLVVNVTNKFGRPLWITEFACQDNADSTTKPFSQADVNAFIDQIIPWLENNPNVHRYAWHSASGGTSALFTPNGELTETGRRYARYNINSLKTE